MKSCADRLLACAIILVVALLSASCKPDSADENEVPVASVDTESVKIEVNSVLGPEGGAVVSTNIIATLSSLPDIRDIQPPVKEMPVNAWWIVLPALAAIVLLITPAFIQWRRHLARVCEKKALRDLNRLKQAGMIEADDVRHFYLRLNRILRKYIQRCYGIELSRQIPSLLANWLGAGTGSECRLSRTNRELIEDLRRQEAGEGEREAIYDVLQECDLVKFAHKMPAPDTARDALSISFQFVKNGLGARKGGARQ